MDDMRSVVNRLFFEFLKISVIGFVVLMLWCLIKIMMFNTIIIEFYDVGVVVLGSILIYAFPTKEV